MADSDELVAAPGRFIHVDDPHRKTFDPDMLPASRHTAVYHAAMRGCRAHQNNGVGSRT
jgi:hypothetical protein